MNRIIIALIMLAAFKSVGQSKNNRYERLTRKEFRELMIYRDNFIPTNIGDTVIIIRYSGEKLRNMQNLARSISLAKNGTDTTGLKIDSLSTSEQILKSKAIMEKAASSYIPLKIQKRLKKRGIESLIVDERELMDSTKYKDKYWIKTTFTSNQKSLWEGWMVTLTYLFFDPKTDKDFETFLPTNYDLMDLMK